uniref:Uncharacterized protein n=1 Tax=Timema genevievae TaxID=629358 RepID=A0A7R9PKX3_TIMGE|nr:unnamed protein product [Timema genevievae]
MRTNSLISTLCPCSNTSREFDLVTPPVQNHNTTPSGATDSSSSLDPARQLELFKTTEKKKMRVVRKVIQNCSYDANTFLTELKLEDGSGFRNFTRVSLTDFEVILQMFGPRIMKKRHTI